MMLSNQDLNLYFPFRRLMKHMLLKGALAAVVLKHYESYSSLAFSTKHKFDSAYGLNHQMDDAMTLTNLT